MSVRRICRVLEHPRSTQRQYPIVTELERALREEIIRLACLYGRYGYRRMTMLLRGDGWHVNHKRVEWVCRQEGLKMPQKRPKRKRLRLNDGPCIRLRPEYMDHVWSYDFVADRNEQREAFRMLTVLDEYSRESLAVESGV